VSNATARMEASFRIARSLHLASDRRSRDSRSNQVVALFHRAHSFADRRMIALSGRLCCSPFGWVVLPIRHHVWPRLEWRAGGSWGELPLGAKVEQAFREGCFPTSWSGWRPPKDLAFRWPPQLIWCLTCDPRRGLHRSQFYTSCPPFGRDERLAIYGVDGRQMADIHLAVKSPSRGSELSAHYAREVGFGRLMHTRNRPCPQGALQWKARKKRKAESGEAHPFPAGAGNENGTWKRSPSYWASHITVTARSEPHAWREQSCRVMSVTVLCKPP